MKRIKFTKLLNQPAGAIREGYPGYLFTHTNHPGREFVLARGSQSRGDGSWGHTNKWNLHDRASGTILNWFVPYCSTRTELEEYALVGLHAVTPEALAAFLERCQIRRMTQILKEKP